MEEPNKITESIIGSAIEVHRALGPGLLESAYEAALAYELTQKHHLVKQQQDLPIMYKGMRLDGGYRLDLVVDQIVIVELKSIERFEPIHEAQLLTYLRLSGMHVGLLINFNMPVLRQGIKRLVNNLPEKP